MNDVIILGQWKHRQHFEYMHRDVIVGYTYVLPEALVIARIDQRNMVDRFIKHRHPNAILCETEEQEEKYRILL